MITLEDWIMIKHMHKQGVPKTRIAKELGLDRKTVRAAIDRDGCPKHERQSMGSILDPYKDYIKQRLEKYDLTATRLQPPDYSERSQSRDIQVHTQYCDSMCSN